MCISLHDKFLACHIANCNIKQIDHQIKEEGDLGSTQIERQTKQEELFKRSSTRFLEKKSDENLIIPHFPFADCITCVKGNSQFEDAEIILIGDTFHDNVLLQAKILAFLEEFSTSDDAVLREGFEYLTPTGLDNHIGWDDMKLVNVCRENLKKLGEIEKQMDSLQKQAQNEFRLRERLGIDQQYESLKQQHRSLNEETMCIAVEKRNDPLLQAINCCKNNKKIRRVFVVAGDLHYTDAIIKKIEDKKYIYFRFANAEVKTIAPELSASPAMRNIRPTKFKNRVPDLITVKLANGKDLSLGPVWFKNPEQAKVGEKIQLDESQNWNDLDQLKGLKPGTEYEIVSLKFW